MKILVKVSISFLLLFITFTSSQAKNHKIHFSSEDQLSPEILRPYMFTKQINGEVDILLPSKQDMDKNGNIISEQYIVEMKKIKQQILPKELFNETTIYAYGGQTQVGYRFSLPGPMIMATKGRPTKVKWRNLIEGRHILPVDYNYPFKSTPAFRNQVPVSPHNHGVATHTISDGEPQAYWTAQGSRSQHYRTQQPCAPNQAVYIYPNQQDAGNNWFHDHTIGITRLNVYAGLVGWYKIIQENIYGRGGDIKGSSLWKQERIVRRHGMQVNQSQTKFLVIMDKSFSEDGELWLPKNTENPKFSSWVPEFFGNTILVNGVVWPKMTLKKGKHRFVILNACPDRYLNIYFENLKKKIPMELIRIDSDYYDQQIIVTQLFATISSRIEIILDLTHVQGEIIVKNNAPAPYPSGDQQNLVPEFTGQIMKIIVQGSKNLSIDQEKLNIDLLSILNYQQITYPAFSQGQKVFSTLFQVQSDDEQVDAVFIDGMAMKDSQHCANSTYSIGKTYDFYIINATPDMHPIHFHLINMQKVKQYPFDTDAYLQQYYKINGGEPSVHGFQKPPISFDPQPFRKGPDQYPKPYEKIFKDTIDCDAEYVTVLRIKFAKNDGTSFKSLNLKGARFVWHCHMLSHQDNEMMKYYCLE